MCKIVAECFLQMCEATLVFSEHEDLAGVSLHLVHDLRFHWQKGCCLYLHLKQTKTEYALYYAKFLEKAGKQTDQLVATQIRDPRSRNCFGYPPLPHHPLGEMRTPRAPEKCCYLAL